jgi:hypothetical protein
MKFNLKKNLNKFNLKNFNNFYLKNSYKTFSNIDLDLPIIDVKKFLNKSSGWEAECKLIADCFHETGIVVIKDPVNIL